MHVNIYKKFQPFFLFLLVLSNFVDAQNQSIAKLWNKELIKAIRKDFARPPIHSRNLYHLSVAMHDAWAVYENDEEMYFLGKTIGTFSPAFLGVPIPSNIESAQKEALSFACYRLLRHRFQNSPGVITTTNSINSKMDSLGYNRNNISLDYINGGSAELGNYIANRIIAWGYQDGSNEINNYANQYYLPVNDVIRVEEPGNPNMVDPNRWQAISLTVAIDQSGNLLSSTPPHLAAEWGNVQPFALADSLKTLHIRNGNTYKVYRDVGAPPQLDTINAGDIDDFYKWNYAMVSVWQSHLDTTDNVIWDISPANIGNTSSYPNNFNEYQTFYDFFNGGEAGSGRSINPITGQAYLPQLVKRGDYARVLAEFWADGLDSETPAGHWFAIYNKVSADPLYVKQWAGQGSILNDLEYDIKAYLTLSGGMHDAAICAWSHKGWYDSPRPVSTIRYMAGKGQSTNNTLPNYHPAGIPLLPGYIEIVTETDSLAGANNEHVGKIKLYTWKGPDYITDPLTTMSGVGWILAENFWPYQRPTFVSPPFAGYISGHSTFSAAAAEIMTQISGSEYFPGGMSNFVAQKDEFLHFEDGPSQTITLQWATYKDASDQCSLSRIWGGIHPPIDDIPGRIIGHETGSAAFIRANSLFEIQKPFVSTLNSSISVVNLESIDDTLSLFVSFSEPMDTVFDPVITFLNVNHPLLNSLQFINSGWNGNQLFKLNYKVLAFTETLDSVFVQVKNAKNLYGLTQKIFISERPFRVDKQLPILTSVDINYPYISDNQTDSTLTLTINYNEKCITSTFPTINFFSTANLQQTFTADLLSSAWISDFTYKAVFTIADNNETIDSIHINISGTTDLAGNVQAVWVDSNAVHLDTQNPILVSLTVNDENLNSSDIGAQALILELSFDKEMNQSTIPELIFTTSTEVNSVLVVSESNTVWESPTSCKLTYNLQNQPFELFGIDVSISNLKDLAGNIPQNETILNLFNIDTRRPEIVQLSASSPIISDANVGNGLFTITLEYSESMNTLQKPVIQLLNNSMVVSDVAYHIFSSTWMDAQHFKAFFNITDTNVELEELVLSVNFGQDVSGNPQSIVTIDNYIKLDTKNPEIIFLFANAYSINNSLNELTILNVFSEPLQQNLIPEFQFVSDLNISTLFSANAPESGWLNAHVYEAVYDVNHSDALNGEVAIIPNNIFDMAGNEIEPITFDNFLQLNIEWVGILENSSKIGAFIYPNPIQNPFTLNLSLTDGVQVEKLSIISIDGKIVYSENVYNNDLKLHTIDVSYLTAGMYFLEIYNKTNALNLKFIINN